MKRGFLLRAAEKKKAAERHNRERQTSTQVVPQSGTSKPQLPTRREDLPPEYRLAYGDLTEQEKALPEDYDKDKANFLILPRDPEQTNVSPGETLITTMPHIDDSDGTTEWIIKDPDAKAKVFKTPGYPSRISKPRCPDLYEVRTTPDMGQGIFAKCNIKRGDLIFSERPLLIAPSWLGRDGTSDKYTLNQVQQVMMFEFEKVLEVAVQRMSEKERALFMALHNSHTADGTGPLLGIMRTNAFGVGNLSNSDVMNYGAVSDLGSRFNHSCVPNVGYKFEISSFSFQSIAARDIEAGEQLFVSYCQLHRTKAERQTDLAPYGFSCNCPACVNATPATDKLRKTFKDQIMRHNGWIKQPEWTDDILSSALLLEADIVAEGLDCEVEFYALLTAIYVSFAKLGRKAEMAKYKKRLMEYHKIYVHSDEPFPLEDL